jgi:hypothetical protein
MPIAAAKPKTTAAMTAPIRGDIGNRFTHSSTRRKNAGRLLLIQ